LPGKGDAEVARHIDLFHKLCVDPHIRRFLLDGQVVDRDWARDALAKSAASTQHLGVGLWLTEHAGQVIGFCGYHHFHDLTPEPQLLYALTEPHTGQGYATEMAEALVEKAWALGWSRVVSAVDAPNRASRRVLEKVGFTPCGTVPGTFGDTLLVERFRDERPAPVLEPGTEVALSVASTWNGEPLGRDEVVTVTLKTEPDEIVISIDAPFHDDPAPQAPVGSTPRLWEHEVVEVMWLGEDERYLEVELSPHGHYLNLVLEGVRQVVHQGMVMHYEAIIEGKRWRGRARIPTGWLPPGCDRLNAYAIHGRGSMRRYLSWRPPGGEAPDFHRLEHFGRLGELMR
jgi:RimJ/RimL family protein N-acetyltransferase